MDLEPDLIKSIVFVLVYAVPGYLVFDAAWDVGRDYPMWSQILCSTVLGVFWPFVYAFWMFLWARNKWERRNSQR